MIEAYALSAVTLAAAGIVLALLAVISLKIRREETAYTFTEPTADRLATWVRGVNGLYVRNPGIARQVRQEPLRLAGQDRSSTAASGRCGPGNVTLARIAAHGRPLQHPYRPSSGALLRLPHQSAHTTA